jgi:trans-aconitate 2-methyltransferase
MADVSKEEISKFYDTWLDLGDSLKLNIRHYTIFQELHKAGLKKNHKVLEIGCGHGTVTNVIASYLKSGSITGTDISPQRIATAQKLLAKHKHANFVVTDMTDFNSGVKYDFIVLPDVLEHIPVEAHRNLFATFARHAHADTQVFIHVPHPTMIAWAHIHEPDKLQIIDQSIHSPQLLADTSASGWRLHLLKSYCLAKTEPDYQVIIFKRDEPYGKFQNIPVNKTRWEKLKRRLYYFFAKL